MLNNTKAINDLRSVLNSGYATVTNLGAIYGMDYLCYEFNYGGVTHQIMSHDGLLFTHTVLQKARRGYDTVSSENYTLTAAQAKTVLAMLG